MWKLQRFVLQLNAHLYKQCFEELDSSVDLVMLTFLIKNGIKQHTQTLGSFYNWSMVNWVGFLDFEKRITMSFPNSISTPKRQKRVAPQLPCLRRTV